MADKVNDDVKLNGKAKEILFQSMELIMKNLKANMDHLSKPKYFAHTQKFINLVYDEYKYKIVCWAKFWAENKTSIKKGDVLVVMGIKKLGQNKELQIELNDSADGKIFKIN